MKIEDKFESSHFPGETLTVDRIYTGNMFSLRIGDTGRTVMAKNDPYDGAKLMLVHISREAMRLVQKTEKIQGF